LLSNGVFVYGATIRQFRNKRRAKNKNLIETFIAWQLCLLFYWVFWQKYCRYVRVRHSIDRKSTLGCL